MPAPDRVVAAACQVDVTAAVADRSVLVDAVAEAAASGAGLVVLPELVGGGGTARSPEEAAEVAEPADGPFVSALAELSHQHGCVVVAGFAERIDGGTANAAVVLDRGRVVGVYRKAHPWGTENAAYVAAAEPPLVVDTSAGRVGTMVCYDLEFPEWVRLAAQAGAEVLAVPVNWPLRPDGHQVEPFEVVKARAAAATYRVNVVVADRCGPERDVDWYGGSLVCDVDGRLLAGPAWAAGRAAEPALVTATVDLAAARDKHLGPSNHVWDDRRPELY